MKSTVAILVITLATVVFGIFNKRWSVACALFVLHIVIGGFIIGFVTHVKSEHQLVASPFQPFTLDKDLSLTSNNVSQRRYETKKGNLNKSCS